jgi:hypothetical protein
MPDNFWVDEPDPSKGSSFNSPALGSLFKIYYHGTALILFGVVLFLLWYITGPIVTASFIILTGFSYYWNAKRKGSLKSEIAAVESIQARARELIRAEYVGSAIHTAGHPLLSLDQPVVLALKGDQLSIYSYESSTPIDKLSINQILKAQTVVYDQDRIPHVEVLDKTAQALQLVVMIDGNEYIALFRRFRKHKAIDWYHAIQQAR